MASARLRRRRSCSTSSPSLVFPWKVATPLAHFFFIVLAVSDETMTRDSIRVAKEGTLGKKPCTSRILTPPPASAVVSGASAASGSAGPILRSKLESTYRPTSYRTRSMYKFVSPHIDLAPPHTTPQSSATAPILRAPSNPASIGSPVKASFDIASDSATDTRRSLHGTSTGTSVEPMAHDQRPTALEHDLGAMHEGLHRLIEHASPAPVYPPAWAPASPAVDLPAGGAPETRASVKDTVKYPFWHCLLTYFVPPTTSNVPDDIHCAAQRALTTMAQHSVVSTLPLSIPVSDISDGAISPRYARRIYTVEATLHPHNLDAGSDGETCTHTGRYSYRVPMARSSNPIPLVPPSVRPVVAQRNPVLFPPDASTLEHDDQIRDRYNPLSEKSKDKFILPPPNCSLPDNTSRRVLSSFRLVVCRTVRFSNETLQNPKSRGYRQTRLGGSLGGNAPCTDWCIIPTIRFKRLWMKPSPV